MVEIKYRMLRKLCLSLSLAAISLAGVVCAQQPAVEARIAGLEDNGQYMDLLREDARLQFREDSIVRAVEGLRRQLREDPAGRQRYSQEILDLENRIFEIRGAKGRLIGQINTIEQEWVLANLNGAGVQDELSPAAAMPDSLKVRNLVDNLCFRQELPAPDYVALQRAQRMEMQAVDYINRFFGNYSTAADLAAAYEAAPSEEEALAVFDRYKAVQSLNRIVEDSLSRAWNYIFDNKSYAYGYLMDKLGEDEVLALEEERSADAARRMSALRGQTASDVVTDYFLRKRVAVDYETAVAEVLELDEARDSLKGVAAQLDAIDYRLPKLEVAQRSFIQYDSIAFSTTPKYSYQHPIPECRVYAHGTVYRILLGTFNTKRAASTFRGAYPLCYRIDDNGKWCYYAGGYATREQAEAAQALLKTRGFIRPEIVVWTDGAYRNLTRDPEALEAVYRVEINGTEVLTEAMKSVIRSAAEGPELSRVGQTFIVGTFDDRAVAERLAAELQALEPVLEIKVAEISE